MIAVLLLVLTILFPLILYFVLKAIAWVDFRKRTLPALAGQLNDVTRRHEAFVTGTVAPTNPELAAEWLRKAAEQKLILTEASNVGAGAYLLRRPGLEVTLEKLVHSASDLYASRARAAADPPPPSAH
ncbi:MAG: hypothetical protein EA350_09515 [Gemmatimonadales bacterium]|nr:MAG: hypothetical protein EA350_09515 [Gemmatimonadales bacterium]